MYGFTNNDKKVYTRDNLQPEKIKIEHNYIGRDIINGTK